GVDDVVGHGGAFSAKRGGAGAPGGAFAGGEGRGLLGDGRLLGRLRVGLRLGGGGRSGGGPPRRGGVEGDAAGQRLRRRRRRRERVARLLAEVAGRRGEVVRERVAEPVLEDGELPDVPEHHLLDGRVEAAGEVDDGVAAGREPVRDDVAAGGVPVLDPRATGAGHGRARHRERLAPAVGPVEEGVEDGERGGDLLLRRAEAV